MADTRCDIILITEMSCDIRELDFAPTDMLDTSVRVKPDSQPAHGSGGGGGVNYRRDFLPPSMDSSK
jgi:hypothetical protein